MECGAGFGLCPVRPAPRLLSLLALTYSNLSAPPSMSRARNLRSRVLQFRMDASVASVLTRNDRYFAALFDPDLAVERAKTMEDLRKARSIAHAFRSICPSYY